MPKTKISNQQVIKSSYMAQLGLKSKDVKKSVQNPRKSERLKKIRNEIAKKRDSNEKDGQIKKLQMLIQTQQNEIAAKDGQIRELICELTHNEKKQEKDDLENMPVTSIEHNYGLPNVSEQRNVLSKKFICNDCGSQFTQKSHFKDHKNEHCIQQPIKNETCQICGKKTTHSKLRKHLRNYTNPNQQSRGEHAKFTVNYHLQLLESIKRSKTNKR